MNIEAPRASLLVSISFFFLLVSTLFPFAVSAQDHLSQTAVGVLMNLDLSELVITVTTTVSGWPKDPDKLKARVIKKLIDSGIYQPAERLKSSAGPGLRLTYTIFPSDCPDKGAISGRD
jgi:hypothetical protein